MTIFTLPGKLGDALLQWPIAFHWAKQTGQKFTAWVDENSLKPLIPLLEAQECVEKVEAKPGIINYNCGGQPWHFDLDTEEYKDKLVYHLGLRGFPQRQITLETLASSRVPVNVSQDDLASTPVFSTNPDRFPKIGRRLVLHGQGVYAHTKSSPTFWRFLHSISGELQDLFPEIFFVGDKDDLGCARETYPKWGEFDDKGNMKDLADFMAGSDMVIGCGSSMVAMAGALKVPCIRVHDPIGQNPRMVWDNLGDNQLNRTEIELRTEWPNFRDRWLLQEV